MIIVVLFNSLSLLQNKTKSVEHFLFNMYNIEHLFYINILSKSK